MTAPRKVAAFDPAARLLEPVRHDPGMRRPASTAAGAGLVLLRVIAGVLWLLEVAAHWSRYANAVAVGGITFSPEVLGVSLVLFLTVGGLVLLVYLALAVLIFRGRDLPRVIVLLFSVISIGGAFAAWWVDGQRITLHTTLLSLGLDILVLLALSSRSAAAYARRDER